MIPLYVFVRPDMVQQKRRAVDFQIIDGDIKRLTLIAFCSQLFGKGAVSHELAEYLLSAFLKLAAQILLGPNVLQGSVIFFRIGLAANGVKADAAVKLRLQIAFFVGLQDGDVMSMGRQLVCKADQHFFRPAED